jgi:hypothetical protein
MTQGRVRNETDHEKTLTDLHDVNRMNASTLLAYCDKMLIVSKLPVGEVAARAVYMFLFPAGSWSINKLEN